MSQNENQNKNTFRSAMPGQILVTTLLVLVVISITIVTITATVTKDLKQTSQNLGYDRAYNDAETRLINAAGNLSRVNTPISAVNIPGYDCETLLEDGVSKARCALEESTDRRTILTIYDVNYIDNLTLGNEDYLDLSLQTTAGNYENNIELNWIGASALELTLVYKLAGELKTAQTIVDASRLIDADPGNDILTANTLVSGFLRNIVLPSAAQPDILAINFSNTGIDSTIVPAGSEYQYLRIRLLNRQLGSAITIKPEATASANFPLQVRRIEAITYDQDTTMAPVPVIVTQLPLSPATPITLQNVLSFDSLRTPICGDGLLEGAENCDDGNIDDSDSCPANCRCTGSFARLNFDTRDQYDFSVSESPHTEICLGRFKTINFTPDSTLDDILLIIKSTDSVTISGDDIIFPEPYFMITPTSGIIDGYPKNFHEGVIGNKSIIGCQGGSGFGGGVPNPCGIDNFIAQGYRVYSFGTPIPVPELESLGFVDGTSVKFKLVHVAAGWGGAMVTLQPF